MSKYYTRATLAAAGLLAALPGAAHATPTALDYSGMTDAIDVGSTVAAIMTVGGIIILVAVAIMGVRKVKSMVK